MILILLSPLALFSCSADIEICNGMSILCDRSPAEVFFAGSHNSMSSSEEEWLAPNHHHSIPTQLRNGIRALNIDTYWWEEEAYMCHGFCEIGAQPLSWATDHIALFLEEDPNNVLIVTFQSTLTAEQTLDAFTQSGIEGELYTHNVDTEWPSLQTLIDNRKRLLVFSNSGGGVNGYMEQWLHWVDTPYSASTIEDFDCYYDRGDPQNASLFNINHFLTAPIALPELAEEANQEEVLRTHIDSCITEHGRIPNQILVDFYSIGDVISVVQSYNENF